MRQYTSDSVISQFGGAKAQNLTDDPVSKSFPISADGAKNILVGVLVSDVTVATAISLKLQSSLQVSDSSAWRTAKTASVTVDGWVYLSLNVEAAGDQSVLPLGPAGRVVVTTGAGDSLSIDAVIVCQRN